MAQIIKVKEHQIVVDDEDYEYLSSFRWYVQVASNRNNHYASRVEYKNGKSSTILMHQMLIGRGDGLEIDHINGNSLDNRKSNLRVCTVSENQRNRGPQKNNTSGYKGVKKRGNRWIAQIQVHKKTIDCGSHMTPQEAARAYNEKAKILHGEFAKLNDV